MAKPNLRPDHNGTQRAQFDSNKRKIFATQRVCGICGAERQQRGTKAVQLNELQCRAIIAAYLDLISDLSEQ